MADGEDLYRTIDAPAEAQFKERSSKFFAYAYPVSSPEEAMELVEGLRKRYYDATHHCYAYRLGADGGVYRANDDGEPSGTAGRPILGQMLSAGVTYCLIVVVRYFGGTKLGVSGLINAYRESAAGALAAAKIVEKTVDTIFTVAFPYVCMNDVMKTVKEEQPRIVSQHFDNLCTMTLAIRRSRAAALEAKLGNVEGADVKRKG